MLKDAQTQKRGNLPLIAIVGTFLFIFLFHTSLVGFSPLYTIATADEICNNGVDDDGDGLVDNTDPDCQATACYTASHSYYKVILYPMIQNANGSVTIKVAVQNFRNRALSHVRFELPSGVSASAPGSTYQGIRNNYSIENPSSNPYRNINFNVIGEGVKNGKADVLEFTLPAGAPILSTIRVEIKMGSSKYSTSLSTNNCTPANCTNVTNAGQINLVSFNCSSVNIQNQVAATGGSGTLEYRWQQRTFSGSSWSDWTTIANANGSAFSSGAILQLTELRRQSRRATCQDWLNSNTVQISFTEICDNGIDDDCDGLIDCYDPDCSQTTRYSTNVRITISTSSSGTYTSVLPIAANGIIRKVSVVGLDIAHTYIDDLIIKLRSPSGTEITLLNRICSSQDNIYVTFDQDATSSSLPCPPTSGAAYRPYQSLSAFVGENASGNWTLTISDLASNDGGQLKNWGLEIHTECLPPCQNNLLSNPGFESNTSNWTVSNGSYNTPSSYVVEGSKIVWIYPNSSGSTVSIQQVVTGITPGQVYHLSFFGGTHNPSYQHRVFMEFLNNSNSVLSSAYVEVDRDVDILSLLQLYSLEAAAPSGATKLRIKGTANGDYLKLDRFCLRNNNPCALFSVAASNDENLCLGGTATITATPSGGLQPFSYNWSNGAGSGASRDVSPTSSTTYTVTATDAAGCAATDQVAISVINCTEICDDGIDNDGDGTIDCADSDCVGSSNQAVSSVAAGSDDAEQTISNGSMSLSETTIDLGAESSAPQIAGFRFTNISIPPKAKIVNAYIEFETTGLSQSGSDFIIKMEDNPNPGTFQNSTGNLSGRLKLVNSVTWENAGSWSVANKRKKTSNLASLVQEMIDNPSWQSGNAMAFFIEGSGTRGLKSFEAGKAPVLVITFDQAPNTHSLLKTYALDDSYEAIPKYDADPMCSSADWQNFRFKFEPPDGFWMDEYSDGTAVLRGTIQNQLDQCDQWDVYVKLKNKRNWSAWSALGRTYYAAANASCSQNHPQWNYYELDENVSRWSGRIGSCNEGKVTIIKHNPPNKMKGIQVGQGSSNCQGCDCDQVTVRGWYRMCGDLNLPCGDFGSSLGGFDHESPCLILNSDFENGFQYWDKDPDVVLTSDASSGSNAARIFGNDRGLNINDLPGEEGKIYNLTFDAKKAEAISWAGVGIDFYDGSRNRLNKVVTSVESSTYKTYSLGAIAPPGTVFVDIWVWKGTGGQLYVDNFCLSVEDDEGSHLCGLINPGFESPTSTGWTGFGSHTRSNDAVVGNFAFQTPGRRNQLLSDLLG